VVTPLLEEPIASRPSGTIARMRAEIEAREGVCISRRRCPRRCEKKFRYRLQLRERQAAAGDIVLLYAMRARR
jgi:hypothetical protein